MMREFLSLMDLVGGLRVFFAILLLLAIGFALMRSIRPKKRQHQVWVYLLTTAVCILMLWLMLEPIWPALQVLGWCWMGVIAVIFMVIGAAIEDEV